jgi:hypothetical protein
MRSFTLIRRAGQTQQGGLALSLAAPKSRRSAIRLGPVMRDLTRSGRTIPRFEPKGLVFEIAGLILIRSWAAFHEVPTSIHLDHGAEDEEYEEVIALQTGSGPFCRMILWRNADTVFIQPLVGKARRHGSVAEALESLLVKQPIILTDIVAAAWPADEQGTELVACRFDGRLKGA